MRLLELIEQDHRKGLLAHTGDQGIRFAAGAAVAADDLGGGLGTLKFAHIEANEAIGRAEQILRRRLGELRLAGTRRAREQQYANRLAGIVEARLQHGDTLDDGRDGLVLADHPGAEVGPDLAEVDALLIVEDADRQAGQLRQGGDYVAGLDVRTAALARPVRREADQVDGGTGKIARTHVLARRAQRRVDRAWLELEARLAGQSLNQTLRQCRRALLVLRFEANDFQQAAQGRAELQEPRHVLGRNLGPHQEPPGLDGGKDLIENAGRLALVRAAARELQDVGNVPDQLLAHGRFFDGALNAALELAEPLLARHQIGAPCLENRPAAPRQPARQELQKRGLSDPGLPADDERTHRRQLGARLRSVQRLAPLVEVDQELIVLASPTRTDRTIRESRGRRCSFAGYRAGRSAPWPWDG